MSRHPSKPALSDEALTLLVQVRFGNVPPSVFEQWRRMGPDHQAAAAAAEQLWLEIGKTETASQFRQTEALAKKSGISRRGLMLGGGAAAAAIAAGVTLSMDIILADFSTRAGERRSINLPDGSVASLNTASRLSLRYGATERRVILSAGEAFFTVAKEHARPFVVQAGHGEVKAVGTAFSVRRDGDGARVMVSEGVVAVGGAISGETLLGAGQGLHYGSGDISAAMDMDVSGLTAWRRGKLIVNQLPLGEVAREVERYLPGRLVVTDRRLKALPVTGVFDLDDPAGIVGSMAQTLPLRVYRLPYLTVLG